MPLRQPGVPENPHREGLDETRTPTQIRRLVLLVHSAQNRCLAEAEAGLNLRSAALAVLAQAKVMNNWTNYMEIATLGGCCFWCTETICHYQSHSIQPYCRLVIRPKVEKFEK